MSVVLVCECEIVNYGNETNVRDDQSRWNILNKRAAVNAKGCLTFRNFRNPLPLYVCPPVEQLVDSRHMYYWETRALVIRERLKSEG